MDNLSRYQSPGVTEDNKRLNNFDLVFWRYGQGCVCISNFIWHLEERDIFFFVFFLFSLAIFDLKTNTIFFFCYIRLFFDNCFLGWKNIRHIIEEIILGIHSRLKISTKNAKKEQNNFPPVFLLPSLLYFLNLRLPHKSKHLVQWKSVQAMFLWNWVSIAQPTTDHIITTNTVTSITVSL